MDTIDTSNFTPEQLEKAKACKTSDELVALAQAEGIDLTDEQLDAISGGKHHNYAKQARD